MSLVELKILTVLALFIGVIALPSGANGQGTFILLDEATDLQSAQNQYSLLHSSIANQSILESTDSPAWLGLDLSLHPQADFLHLSSAMIRRFEIYDAITAELLFSGGNLSPDSDRAHFHPEFLLPLEELQQKKLLVQILARNTTKIPVHILDARAEGISTALRFLSDGLYFGALILMIIFSLCIAVYGRDAHHARLCIILFAWLATMVTVLGYGPLLLWPDYPVFNDRIYAPLITCAALTSNWFARYFLKHSRSNNLFVKLHHTITYLCFVCLLAAVFFDVALPALLLLLLAGLLTLLSSVLSMRQGDREAKSFILSALFAIVPNIVLIVVPGIQYLISITATISLVFLGSATLQRLGRRIRASELEATMAESRSRFLASMSHEIRTPLNGIIGFSELCMEEKPKGELKTLVGQIARSSNMLLSIVNDVLDFSKIEADSLEIENLPTSVRQTIDDVLAMVRPTSADSAVSFAVEIPKDFPEFIVTDPNRLAQILTNLCSNAIKFTARGLITIRLHANAEMLRFEIIDTGIGIEESLLVTLFDPFKQASAATARQYGGTGLGLTISKQLANLIGGELTVQSEPGKGSTFTLTIPFVSAENPAVAFAAESNLDLSALSGLRVLIAEDNQVNQIVASRILERAGCKTEIAENGKQAVELAMLNQHDLILMDMQMPELNGIEATRQIRNVGITTPIIAMTANTSNKDKQDSFQAGMNDFLSKPIQSKSLYRVLSSWAPQQTAA